MLVFYSAGYFGRTSMVLNGGITGAIVSVLTLTFFEAWVANNVHGDRVAMGWESITGLVLGYTVGGFAGMVFGVWAIERHTRIMRLKSGIDHSFGGVFGGIYGMLALSRLWSGMFAIAWTNSPVAKLAAILGVVLYPIGLPILGAYLGYIISGRISSSH